MIESTIIVKDEMVEINLEYAKEIEEFITLIRKNLSPKTTDASAVENTREVVVSEQKEPSDSKKTGANTGEHQTSSNPSRTSVHDDTTPSWAKCLWKKIALKCHPDRLNFMKLPNLEIAKRQMMFSQARDVYTNRDWKKLLYFGIILDEYVDDLTMAEQYAILEQQYNEAATGVATVQTSLAWKWGTDWKNLNMRIQIIKACCQNKSIMAPNHETLMRMLIKFESE